jgi:hypothetical protein
MFTDQNLPIFGYNGQGMCKSCFVRRKTDINHIKFLIDNIFVMFVGMFSTEGRHFFRYQLFSSPTCSFFHMMHEKGVSMKHKKEA